MANITDWEKSVGKKLGKEFYIWHKIGEHLIYAFAYNHFKGKVSATKKFLTRKNLSKIAIKDGLLAKDKPIDMADVLMLQMGYTYSKCGFAVAEHYFSKFIPNLNTDSRPKSLCVELPSELLTAPFSCNTPINLTPCV